MFVAYVENFSGLCNVKGSLKINLNQKPMFPIKVVS